MVGKQPTDVQVVDWLDSSTILLYMKSLDQSVNLCRLNPSWLAQCVRWICGEVLQIKPLEDGQLLLEVDDMAQAVKLLDSQGLLSS